MSNQLQSPVTTTQAIPPPPKTPPVPAPSLPKHFATHGASTARSSTGATSKPPPPSPSPTTSSEDPVLLMTNVPILKKARPGQPPHRLFSHLDPPHYYRSTTSSCSLSPPSTANHNSSTSCPHTVTPKFGSRDHIATATSCLSTFRTTSSNIWTPMWTAYPPLRQHHHVQHLPQLTRHTAFHHHHNPLHLPYFHHSHHFQNFHSLINRPANLPPLSCGLRAVRLLQRLPTCWVTTSPEVRTTTLFVSPR